MVIIKGSKIHKNIVKFLCNRLFFVVIMSGFYSSVHIGPHNLHLSRMHYRTHVHQPHLTFRDSIVKNKTEIIEFLENQPHIPGNNAFYK